MSDVYIVAGQPGSGKTTFAKRLSIQKQEAKYIAQDTIKEFLFDLIGFENLRLKSSLVELARKIFYQCCEYCLQNDIDIIVDYPFSNVQIDFFDRISNCYQVTIKSFVLYGDPQILYRRIINRESNNRHPGHFANKYPNNRGVDYEVISYKQYLGKCQEREYDMFRYGETKYIDTTNLSEDDYCKLLADLLDEN